MLVLIWTSLLLTTTVLTVSPRMLNSSACKNNSDVLDCLWFSEGFPLPRITWLLLDSISKYTVLKNVLVTSNITVPLKGFCNTTDESISKKTCNETSQVDCNNSTPSNYTSFLEEFWKFLKKNSKDDPWFIFIVFGVGILIGSFVSTFIACLAIKCHRKKKSYSAEKLELVTTETAPEGCDDGIPELQNNNILDIQDDDIQNQVAATSGEEPDGDLINSNMSPKETVYSDIDFSALKQKNPTDATETQDTTETEYAEIKREKLDEAQEIEGIDSEMLEGNDETEVMIERQEEAKQDMLAKEVIEEHVPLYSNTSEDEN